MIFWAQLCAANRPRPACDSAAVPLELELDFSIVGMRSSTQRKGALCFAFAELKPLRIFLWILRSSNLRKDLPSTETTTQQGTGTVEGKEAGKVKAFRSQETGRVYFGLGCYRVGRCIRKEHSCPDSMHESPRWASRGQR